MKFIYDLSIHLCVCVYHHQSMSETDVLDTGHSAGQTDQPPHQAKLALLASASLASPLVARPAAGAIRAATAPTQ